MALGGGRGGADGFLEAAAEGEEAGFEVFGEFVAAGGEDDHVLAEREGFARGFRLLELLLHVPTA